MFPMNPTDTKLALQKLNEGLARPWRVNGEGLEKQFEFADFGDALAFMVRVGIHAEALDHHPEWSNVYNRVQVRLTTHSARSITELDFRLAQFMEAELTPTLGG